MLYYKYSLLGGQVVPGTQPVFPIALPMVHSTKVISRIPFSPILEKDRKAVGTELGLFM